MKITLVKITQKDIEKAKIQFSENGMLIDELAYSIGNWTSEEMYLNNLEYQPSEPYTFDYEADLLENTKTLEQYRYVCKELGLSELPDIEDTEKTHKHYGAYIALHFEEVFAEMLEKYTSSLKDSYTCDSISKKYNEALEKEQIEYNDSLYKEWLHGDRDWLGTIKEVSKHYTSNRDGEYNEKDRSYTFVFEEEDVENTKDYGYNKNQLKKYLLDSIYEKSKARRHKDDEERAKRRAENERVKAYREQRQKEEEEERRQKLEKMLTV